MQDIFDTLFADLKTNISKFGRAFVPQNAIQPVENPSCDRLYDDLLTTFNEELYLHMHAYIVSTHALFEVFFEDLARRIMIKSKEYYDKKNKVNKFLIKLISIDKIAGSEIQKKDLKQNIHHAIEALLNKKQDNTKKQQFILSLKNIIEQAERIFNTYINNNNSIKNTNQTGIYDILCLLGVNHVKVTNIRLYQQLEYFTKQRGDFAHQGIITGITPANAQTLIDNVLLIAQDVTEQAKTLITSVA